MDLIKHTKDLKAYEAFKEELQAEYSGTEPGIAQDAITLELQMLEEDILMTQESINTQLT